MKKIEEFFGTIASYRKNEGHIIGMLYIGH
jgi:hypothetical protein